MSSETDRPIESRLRAYAARRRAASSRDAFVLHPVTRNALQVEVDRAFGRAGRTRPSAAGGWRWWPRLAWAGGLAGIVLLVAVVVATRQDGPALEELALADKSPVRRESIAPARSASPNPVPSSPAEDRLALQAEATTAPSGRQEFVFKSRLAVRVAASGPAAEIAAAPRLAIAGETAPNRALSPTAPADSSPLQGSFRLSIVDDLISILDADQSSYSGRLQPLDPAAAGAMLPNRSLTFEERYYRYVNGGVEQQVPIAAQFVLTGTNLTSRLPVQIVGRMVTQTQAVPAAVAAARASGTDPLAGGGVYLQIQATATVAGRASYPVDASTREP